MRCRSLVGVLADSAEPATYNHLSSSSRPCTLSMQTRSVIDGIVGSFEVTS